MRVLVTGIDGFVGSHTAELLLSDGVEVHGTVRNRMNLRHIGHIAELVRLHQLDVTDEQKVGSLIEELQPDRILHLAGQAFVPASLKSPRTTFQVNLFGGLNVLEAARLQMIAAGKSPSVLIVSSGEAYGNPQDNQTAFTEGTPFNPTNPYGACKASLDIISQQYAEAFGLDVIVVRPFNHAGPRQSPLFVVSDFARQFAQIAFGQSKPVLRVGNLSARRDFTDVRDIVRAYWALFDRRSKERVFNVASGRSIAVREILDLLQEISGTHVEIQEESVRLRPNDQRTTAGNCERLNLATNWIPTISFRTTVHDTYEYWMNHYHSKSQLQP